MPRCDDPTVAHPCCANQYHRLAIAYQPATYRLLLNINAPRGFGWCMKQRTLLPALLLALLPFAAHADCYADYKAKQDNPLKLHYGVIQLPDAACGSKAAAAKAVEARLGGAGWALLSIVSLFGDDGLAERKDSAGAYFLRY